MESGKKDKFMIHFPGNIEYIPSVRRYVSDILQANGFTPKFMYRTEVIVDEICSNAVNYGCNSIQSFIDLECFVFDDMVEFKIKDEGGTKEDRDKLQRVVQRSEDDNDLAKVYDKEHLSGMGLEIVRLLSEKIDVNIDENNVTSIHVVRKREQKKEQVKQG